MVLKKTFRGRRKRCKHCGEILNAIWFTALTTEEWGWNGDSYSECTARDSLVTDLESEVICPNCEKVIGVGRDFGFGVGYK